MAAILLFAIVAGIIYIFGVQKKPRYYETKDKVLRNQSKTRNYLMRIHWFHFNNFFNLEEIEKIIKNKGNEAKTELEKKLLRLYCKKILEDAQEIKDALEQAERDIYINEEEWKVLSKHMDIEKVPDPAFIGKLHMEIDRLNGNITKIKNEVNQVISKAKEVMDISGIKEEETKDNIKEGIEKNDK